MMRFINATLLVATVLTFTAVTSGQAAQVRSASFGRTATATGTRNVVISGTKATFRATLAKSWNESRYVLHVGSSHPHLIPHFGIRRNSTRPTLGVARQIAVGHVRRETVVTLSFSSALMPGYSHLVQRLKVTVSPEPPTARVTPVGNRISRFHSTSDVTLGIQGRLPARATHIRYWIIGPSGKDLAPKGAPSASGTTTITILPSHYEAYCSGDRIAIQAAACNALGCGARSNQVFRTLTYQSEPLSCSRSATRATSQSRLGGAKKLYRYHRSR